jgi:hypothetical protein
MKRKNRATIHKTLKEEYLIKASNDVDNDPIYGPEGAIIERCFAAFPDNNDKDIVAMKICLIDYCNSTNLSKFRKKVPLGYLSDLIVARKDFDSLVQAGDPSIIHDLAEKTDKEKKINLFSFFSKYCCYHNRFCYHKDDYSIYDNVLKRHLHDYDQSATQAAIEKLRVSYDYKGYNDLIGRILDNNRITSKTRRKDFDYLVWYYSK